MPVKNILVFRNDRFGEFLLNIPAFRALKTRYPESKLTLAVNPYVKELARCIEFVDEIITWDNRKHSFVEILKFSQELKNKKFDLCVIFNPSRDFNIISFLAGIPIRVGYNRKCSFFLTHKIEDEKYLGAKHEVEYNLDLARLAGANSDDRTLSLKIDDSAMNKISGFLGNCGNLVVLHPFTSDPIKQWPLRNFYQLSQRLIDELMFKIAVIGGKDELAKSEEFFSHRDSGLTDAKLINLVGRTSLVELAAILKKCRLLISGDSGPVHLASCVGTKTIAIFRNDMPEKSPIRWGPLSPGSIVIQKYNLADITVGEVFNKLKEG